MVCMCDIDDDTYCEYKVHEDGTAALLVPLGLPISLYAHVVLILHIAISPDATWSPSKICSMCVEHLRRTQWKRFEDLIAKADCRAAVLRLCANVPLTVHDRETFVCATHGKDCERAGAISLLWNKATDEKTVPILEGAKQGADREQFIANLKQFAELMEAEKAAELASPV